MVINNDSAVASSARIPGDPKSVTVTLFTCVLSGSRFETITSRLHEIH